MEKIAEMSKCVALLTVPEIVSSVNDRPSHGDYTAPCILGIKLCAQYYGKYYELNSGNEIKTGENTLVWNITKGNAFRTNEGNFLLSKDLKSQKLLWLKLEDNELNPTSMAIHDLRPIQNRMKKK